MVLEEAEVARSLERPHCVQEFTGGDLCRWWQLTFRFLVPVPCLGVFPRMTSVNALCWRCCPRQCAVSQWGLLRRSVPGVPSSEWGILGLWRPLPYVESGGAGALAHARCCSWDRFQGCQRQGAVGICPPACAHASSYAVSHRRGFKPHNFSVASSDSTSTSNWPLHNAREPA